MAGNTTGIRIPQQKFASRCRGIMRLMRISLSQDTAKAVNETVATFNTNAVRTNVLIGIRFHPRNPRLEIYRSSSRARSQGGLQQTMTRSYILIALLVAMMSSIGFAQSDKSITIHQEIDFNASPQQLYEALLDAKQFTEFSGRPAEINREVGGAFSLYKGHIVGRNVELVPNQRIVQAWRVVTWPEGAYSIARFELTPQGSGTRIVFDHVGFPQGLHDHLAEGWEENYWSLLKNYFH